MAEAMFYYSGLCSSPRLVYRTGTTPWTMPTGLEARRLKELRPAFNHKLSAIWKDLDVVRFIEVGEGEVAGPIVLWIGVTPKTLLGEVAHASANGCLDLLKEFGCYDIEVEFRESIYTRSSGPKLLKPASNEDPDVDVRGPLTPTLGLSIAAHATPYIEGTGGIYLAEGGDSQKVLLVTARHVLFPKGEINVGYTTDISAPRKVLLLGTKGFHDFLKSIKSKIESYESIVESYERQIKALQARVADEGEESDQLLGHLADARKAKKTLEELHGKVKKDWRRPSRRVLGHIARSPPITLGTGKEGFTEDYAVVELTSSKIKDAFKGNVIDLGTKLSAKEFTSKMNPCTDAASNVEYPVGPLLPLRDLISENLMRNPDMLDDKGDSCLFVIKNGHATGVTIGRATGIFSYVREHFSNKTHETSMEWAILPYNSKSGPFSDPGDSGSIIADGRGCIGGLLTGGTGQTHSSDITYATPFFWLFPRIKQNGFPNAHLYPVMN